MADKNTLNGALEELGKLMATNLTTKGVASTYDMGLTTLANRILLINGGGELTISLTSDNDILSYTDGDSATLTATVLEGGSGVSGETVNFYKYVDGTNDVLLGSDVTDSNGEASYSYASTGVGDVGLYAKVRSLVSKTYDVEDCIDTILGGGERKINFDRVNFVEGKVLVNGPSLSPQLLPSGVGEYSDITSEATIKVNGSTNNQLKDNIINTIEDKLDTEVNTMSTKATVTVSFEEEKTLRAIMIYDSAHFDYCLPKVDDIEINGKHIKDLMMNEKYYSNDEYLFKIPCSAFIYEFNELTAKEITITLSSTETIYLNEIKVVGK